jgi:spore maturation protein CgeB
MPENTLEDSNPTKATFESPPKRFALPTLAHTFQNNQNYVHYLITSQKVDNARHMKVVFDCFLQTRFASII